MKSSILSQKRLPLELLLVAPSQRPFLRPASLADTMKYDEITLFSLPPRPSRDVLAFRNICEKSLWGPDNKPLRRIDDRRSLTTLASQVKLKQA